MFVHDETCATNIFTNSFETESDGRCRWRGVLSLNTSETPFISDFPPPCSEQLVLEVGSQEVFLVAKMAA